MDSFYSGPAGVSFILKGSFPSVSDMKTAFAAGPDYKDIWFGEFCIIDTVNKNNPDNGKIYQRGLDYQNTTNRGAIYKGQIVGPATGAPFMQLSGLEGDNSPLAEIQKIKNRPQAEQDKAWIRYKNQEGQLVENGSGKKDNGEDDIATYEFNVENHSLIPGKTTTGQYNDKIKYQWVCIRDDAGNESLSWFYVGIESPYLVIDYNTHMISQYDDSGNILDNPTTSQRTDDFSHPFWEEWELGLPKGIKGDSLRNLRIIIPQLTDKIYKVDAVQINPDGSAVVDNSTETLPQTHPDYPSAELLVNRYDGFIDDVKNQRKIFVFDLYVYDEKENPTPITFYVADYNIVTGVNLSDDGTLTLSFSHNDDSVFSKKIRWVDKIHLYNEKTNTGVIYDKNGDPITEDNKLNGGHFVLIDNANEVIFDQQLDWVKNITLNRDENGNLLPPKEENGHLVFYHANGENTEQYLTWVKNVSLEQSSGKFTIYKTTGQDETQLDWIDYIYLNDKTGKIGLHHTDISKNTTEMIIGYDADNNPIKKNVEVINSSLKLVTGASISPTGEITFTCNDGTSMKLIDADDPTHQPYKLKAIQNISLKSGILDDKHITIKYNIDNTEYPIGDSINVIKDTVVRSTDWHLLVMFSDPDQRYPKYVEKWKKEQGLTNTTALALDSTGKDEKGNYWVLDRQVTATDGTTSKYMPNADSEYVYWRDYGPIKDQAGILIGFNLELDREVYPNTSDVIAYLNNDNTGYPAGLTEAQNVPGGRSVAGKIVTVNRTNNNLDEKEFYAFDYRRLIPEDGGTSYGYRGWYYLGSFSDSLIKDAKLSSGIPMDEMSTLSVNGVLLRSIETEYSDVAISEYWKPTYNSWV